MEPRSRIGRYEVLATLDQGGMAELLLAFFSGPGGFRKYVALKRILPALRTQEEFVAMFLDEARISAALSHENIGQVYELGEDKDELYIAMEFIAGQDLSRIVRAARREKKLVPVGFSAAAVRDGCLALHYAHNFKSPAGRALPVIHRDLSPRNIMVTYVGNTKLIDFGIAKAKGSLSTTGTGQVKGSTAYMSPEQVRGEEVDGQSDLFSAGAVLYECLTGQRAFGSGPDAAVMYQVLEKDPRPPHELNPEVSAQLSQVVMRALAKDKKARFQSGREMARAIEDVLGKAIFDEEQLSQYMAAHFAEAMERTREVLSEAGDESAHAKQLVEALKDDGSSPSKVKLRPAPSAAAPHKPDAPTSTVKSASTGPAPTVLLVDDSALLRTVVDKLLSEHGYTVFTAESGQEALSVLEQIQPSLLILDVRMDGMDGFELCERIRARHQTRSTPIIFLSAACSLEERVKGLSVGGDDFVRKPFEAEELVARVKAHLSRVSLLKAANG